MYVNVLKSAGAVSGILNTSQAIPVRIVLELRRKFTFYRYGSPSRSPLVPLVGVHPGCSTNTGVDGSTPMVTAPVGRIRIEGYPPILSGTPNHYPTLIESAGDLIGST
jgi:hypothetical protein